MAHGVAEGAERIACDSRVERIHDPLDVFAVDLLDLVLDSSHLRQLHLEVPEIAAFDPLERLRGRQAEDPASQSYLVGGAVIDEGHRGALDDREYHR